jgi:hypothetical protein
MWECEYCEFNHEKEEDCCNCGGRGDDGEDWCSCPIGTKKSDELYDHFSWMIPMVKEAARAEREGDYETAEAIKKEAMTRR